MRKGEMASSSSSSSASSSSFDDNAKDKLQQRLGDVSQVSGNRCQRSLFPLFHISSSHTTPTSLSTKPPLINCIHTFYFCEMWWKYPWRLVNQKVRLTMILDRVWWMVRAFKDDYWTLWASTDCGRFGCRRLCAGSSCRGRDPRLGLVANILRNHLDRRCCNF